ncbi:hypothetical protein Q75_00615 [Bacillus coahuilensis p1.1.43]|uniref:Uncharacterized protein n=1 Tax=Bacillus coahuilensis p1.1.43 TaxID=1150625 RepID=A0A147KCN8_9BACI|nr:DUF5344 family protein [Bacillus coahuilensis]KUP09457.1 hypothetical protein Q75_00615 [Bacillus coahuilensis p1.1.43]
MSEQIILRTEEIKDLVTAIQSNAEAFEVTLPNNIASLNQLEVIHTLNEMNSLLEEVGELYKRILSTNNLSTQKAIQDMTEVDSQISFSIQER